jgi:hypothetical protein
MQQLIIEISINSIEHYPIVGCNFWQVKPPLDQCMQQIREYLDGCSKLLQQQQVCNQISLS